MAAGRTLLGPGLPWPTLPPLRIVGEHNRANAACVAAMADFLHCDPQRTARALAQFEPLEHRLQWIATVAHRRFYNDSKATSPAAAAAALAAIDGRIWWLAGGHAKGADFRQLAATAVRRAGGAALFGASRDALAEALRSVDASFPLLVTEHMSDALLWSWQQSAPGDAIVLSPACASYDQFHDYADRGQRFASLVSKIGAQHAI